MEFPDEEPCEEDQPSYEAEKEKILYIPPVILYNNIVVQHHAKQAPYRAGSAEQIYSNRFY